MEVNMEEERDIRGASALLGLSGRERSKADGGEEAVAVDFSNADWFDSCVGFGEEPLEAPELFAFFNQIFEGLHGKTAVHELWKGLLTPNGWKKYQRKEKKVAAPQRVVGVDFEDFDLLTQNAAHQLAAAVAHNLLDHKSFHDQLKEISKKWGGADVVAAVQNVCFALLQHRNTEFTDQVKDVRKLLTDFHLQTAGADDDSGATRIHERSEALSRQVTRTFHGLESVLVTIADHAHDWATSTDLILELIRKGIIHNAVSNSATLREMAQFGTTARLLYEEQNSMYNNTDG